MNTYRVVKIDGKFYAKVKSGLFFYSFIVDQFGKRQSFRTSDNAIGFCKELIERDASVEEEKLTDGVVWQSDKQ